MRSILEILGVNATEIAQKHCDKHDETYIVYEVKGHKAGGCPICFSEEMQERDRELVEKSISNSQKWQDRIIEQIERVSDDLMPAKVNNYKPIHQTQEQAKRLVTDYVKNFNGKKSLVLSGTPGLGKSHLAYAATKALRQCKLKTLFIKTTELLDLFRSSYEPGSKISESTLFKLVDSIDLLVLDDVGSEYIKPSEMGHETWASDILYKVMDLRLNKSIICTTNYTESQLEQKYGYNGERIISRMMYKADGIRLQGEDRRRKNRF